jgi:hypothetical protein
MVGITLETVTLKTPTALAELGLEFVTQPLIHVQPTLLFVTQPLIHVHHLMLLLSFLATVKHAIHNILDL